MYVLKMDENVFSKEDVRIINYMVRYYNDSCLVIGQPLQVEQIKRKREEEFFDELTHQK
jgi:hypothetical protein